MSDIVQFLLQRDVRIVEQEHEALRAHRHVPPCQLGRRCTGAALLAELIGNDPAILEIGRRQRETGSCRAPPAAFAALVLRQSDAQAERQNHRKCWKHFFDHKWILLVMMLTYLAMLIRQTLLPVSSVTYKAPSAPVT